MDSVTIRELRNRGGEVVDRVQAGERLTVTRAGKPVAELRPVRSPGLTRDRLVARWRRLRPLDPARLRADVDVTLDASL